MPKHRHGLIFGIAGGDARVTMQDYISNEPSRDDVVTYTGGSGSHTHSFTGSSGNSSILPPYYSLTYIMRVS